MLRKLTDIDLSNLQMGERLTIYRGSGAFLTGPYAAGLVGEATVVEVKKKSAIIRMPDTNRGRTPRGERVYRLRLRDGRICRIPNGEETMLYVHARGGRPTVTVYFTDDEYQVVKNLLREEVETPYSYTTARRAQTALDRMEFHEQARAHRAG